MTVVCAVFCLLLSILVWLLVYFLSITKYENHLFCINLCRYDTKLFFSDFVKWVQPIIVAAETNFFSMSFYSDFQ